MMRFGGETRYGWASTCKPALSAWCNEPRTLWSTIVSFLPTVRVGLPLLPHMTGRDYDILHTRRHTDGFGVVSAGAGVYKGGTSGRHASATMSECSAAW